MATVINLPRDTRWESLGQGVQSGMENYIKGRQEREAAEAMQKILGGVNEAPDRNSALQIVSAAASAVRDPQKIAILFDAVERKYPKGNEDVMQVEAYSPVTGDATPFYIRKGDYGKLNNPEFIKQQAGLEPGTYTLTKPRNVFDYVDPVTGKSVGNYVPGMQPQGSITADDFNRRRQLEADERAEQSAERQDKRLDMEGRRVSAMEARTNAIESRRIREDSEKNAADKTKHISGEEVKLERHLAKVYGGKLLQDGSLDLSSLDEPKRQKFIEDFERGSALLHEGKVKTFGEAVRTINKDRKAEPKDKPKGNQLPAGATRGKSLETTTINGKSVQAYKVFDSKGKHIGWDVP